MPLSEHEQRVLEQMEQALYAEDPRFASQMVGKAQAKAARRRTVLGVIVAVVGLGLVMLAVMLQQIWVGGLGFGAMVLGGFWAFAPTRQKATLGTVDTDGNITVRPGPSAGKGGKGGGKGRGGPRGGSFMDRLEQRWDKRREDGPS